MNLKSAKEQLFLINVRHFARKPVNAFNEEYVDHHHTSTHTHHQNCSSTHRFWTELGRVFDNINEDGNVRAVVLSSGLPKLFTAGLDRQPFRPQVYVHLLMRL